MTHGCVLCDGLGCPFRRRRPIRASNHQIVPTGKRLRAMRQLDEAWAGASAADSIPPPTGPVGATSRAGPNAETGAC